MPKYPKHSANTYLSRCPNQSSSEDAVGTLKNRLQKGLDALGAAAYAVANMQTELEAKNPVGVRLHEAEIMIEPFTCEHQFVRYDMLTTALEGSTACGVDVMFCPPRLEAKQPVLEETKIKVCCFNVAIQQLVDRIWKLTGCQHDGCHH